MVNAVVPMGEKPATFGWLQFEKKAMKELQDLAMRSPPAMGTLMYMVNRMSRSNALVVSQQAIATELKCSRVTVNGAIKFLTAHNFIQVIKAGGSTVYVVNSRVAWQGERGARYAAFGADVIALESEQTAPIDDLPPLKGVPKLHEGERLMVGNERIDPPDQGQLDLS
jgi:Firmicute plasmid replication protein (RepL)